MRFSKEKRSGEMPRNKKSIFVHLNIIIKAKFAVSAEHLQANKRRFKYKCVFRKKNGAAKCRETKNPFLFI